MSLPNAITLFRFFLIPFILYFLFHEYFLVSTLLILFAAFTDLLDGYVARRYNQVTKSGILLDPLADKLLIVVVGVYFISRGLLPLWFILALFYRDISLLFGMLALLYYQREALVPSKLMGKVSAACNILLLILLCLSHPYPFLLPWINILLIFACAGVVFSFLSYSHRWFRLFKEGEK